MIAITVLSIVNAMDEGKTYDIFDQVNKTLTNIQQNSSPASTYNELERYGLPAFIMHHLANDDDLVVGLDCDNDIVYDNQEGSLYGADPISYEEFLEQYAK